jgi:catechol-2,3-dioxygenase
LLRFRDPEGNIIELISNVRELDATYSGVPGKPLSLNHLILYAGDLDKQQEFFVSVLGMRVTDTVPRLMTFFAATRVLDRNFPSWFAGSSSRAIAVDGVGTQPMSALPPKADMDQRS